MRTFVNARVPLYNQFCDTLGSSLFDAVMERLTLTGPRAQRNAWLIWATFALVVCIYGLLTGHERTATGDHREAAIFWFAAKDIYGTGIMGFQYLPHAAIINFPITKLPYNLGEMLWRLLCIGSFSYGVWRLACLARRKSDPSLFLLITLLSIPPAMASARNGQMNLPMAACMMLTVSDLAERRWWRATVWLMLGLGAKPLMIVLILLVAALYRPMLWRIPAALLILLLLPFLAGSPDYVIQQYGFFGHKLLRSTDPRNIGMFDDLFGMVRSFGLYVPLSLETTVRVVAALLTLGVCWLGLNRWEERRGAVLLFALAAVYVVLFNPRSEHNTYAVLGPAIAVFAAWELLVDRRAVFGWALILIVIFVTGGYEIGRHIVPGNTKWLHPTACITFLGYVTYRVIEPPAGWKH